jgi:haloalkane dehalogenase
MYYEEAGMGPPVVFLHGNPTTSYLWRHITPALDQQFRCLAPDLIGMGQSGRPSIGYSFADHARYLDAWFDALDLKDVVLVGHDWGAALAFDWASRNADRVRGTVFMEAVMRPMRWDSMPPEVAERFRALRTPKVGEKIVLEGNDFIERTLRATVLSDLTEGDIAVYTAPYSSPESRKPLLEWTRSMPFDGDPADVVSRIESFNGWLASSSTVPKLLLSFDGPVGSLVIDDAMTAWCRTNVANLKVTKCGPAKHNAPEDQPGEIAAAINNWLAQFEA